MVSLIGCGTVYRTQLEAYCPAVVVYSDEFKTGLSTELDSLPRQSTYVLTAVGDYIALRDTLAVCASEREKL
jgi:hypothetical protein